jgi:hypothetical protein
VPVRGNALGRRTVSMRMQSTDLALGETEDETRK